MATRGLRDSNAQPLHGASVPPSMGLVGYAGVLKRRENSGGAEFRRPGAGCRASERQDTGDCGKGLDPSWT